VTDPAGGVTRYAYDAAGNLTRTDLPNGTFETRQYDALNRLLFVESRTAAGVIASFRYTLAATGRRDAVVEQDGRQVAYTYDALDRLTGEAITDATAGSRTITYTYDAVGNRLTRADSAEGTTAYTYDADDRLLTETLGSAVTQYTYDADGNTLSKATSPTDRATYSWDAENRLVGAAVTDATGTKAVTYRYDADGIRVAAVVAGDETRYLIDQVQPFAQVLLEYKPSGLAVVSYVYGNDLIAQDRGGVKAYYHADGLGSTRALTNAAGAVTDRYYYDAFGRMIRQTGTTVNAYLFAGEQRDANVGLDYLRARYLNVAAGRFFGSDPQSGQLFNPNTLHRFLYVTNRPIDAIDPSGEITIIEVSAAIAIQSYLNYERNPNYVYTARYRIRAPLDRMCIRGPIQERNVFGKGIRVGPNGKPRDHQGWDLSAPVGTRILAIADGKIAFRGNRGVPGYGNELVLQFRTLGLTGIGNIDTLYASYDHLSSIFVSKGEIVHPGDVLGTTGRSGYTSPPSHLHFEIRTTVLGGSIDSGRVIDPARLFGPPPIGCDPQDVYN
jgi:RHS repeat-associated protein